MLENKSLTVSQLTGYIKQLVDRDRLLSHVWVIGEISNYKLHSSGHMYFSLKDEEAVVKCVMFRSHAIRLKFRPEEGMRVLLKGRVSVYAPGGTYQIYGEEMSPDGTGSLYMAYEQLKNKLEELGLFDASRKKPLPFLPRSIGIITSPTGAVIRDMAHVLNRRYTNARVIVYPSAVQGPEASRNLIRGLQCFNRLKNVDVIVLARGGGSLEDLWPFNDEGLAYAIAQSEIPVVSAVGHETDYTIADFVADLRAPTPSAAAELIMPEKAQVAQGLKNTERRLVQALISGLGRERLRVLNLANARSFTRPYDGVNRERQLLDTLEMRLAGSTSLMIERARSQLGAQAGKLQSMSPLEVLKRGYAVAAKANGTVIRTVREIEEDETLRITLADGCVEAKVVGLPGKKDN